MLATLAAAYLVIPTVGSEYWLLTIMIPFLVYALAALGLNLLSGYAGQTITLKFTGSEDSELQTSFVIDDTAVNVS